MTLLYSCTRKRVLTMFIFWSTGFYLGFRLACHLSLIQTCFVEFACEGIYELEYQVVFLGDIAMFYCMICAW